MNALLTYEGTRFAFVRNICISFTKKFAGLNMGKWDMPLRLYQPASILLRLKRVLKLDVMFII